MVFLNIGGGEIFLILLGILILFGADKIPEFTRMMGKGVREFRKATDDIKRELNDSTSGIVNDVRSMQKDMTDSLTKEIEEPMRESMNETVKTFDEYQDPYNADYHYGNTDYLSNQRNEYQEEVQTLASEKQEEASETSDPVSDAAEQDEI